MSTSLWSSFLQDIYIEVPDCPVLLQTNAARDAARVFFRDSGAWRVALPALNVIANKTVYTLPAPTAGVIETILAVTLNGTLLRPEQFMVGQDEDHGWRVTLATAPSQNSTHGLAVAVILWPGPDDTGVPSFLRGRYGEAISFGAKAQLMAQPTRWGNPKLSAYYQRQFDQAVTAARIENAMGLQNAVPRMDIPEFV